MEASLNSNALVKTSSRRGFLLSALSLSVFAISRKAEATYIPSARSISIYAKNTGERFSGTYFENGEYVPEAMAAITRLFRDHRSGAVAPVDAALIDFMVAIRERMRGGQPFELISGYRSPESNAKARRRDRRVARNSFHMQGKAADITLPGFSLRDLRRAATDLRLGGVGTYRGRPLVHIDSGPFRTW